MFWRLARFRQPKLLDLYSDVIHMAVLAGLKHINIGKKGRKHENLSLFRPGIAQLRPIFQNTIGEVL
jgi:hypothetical protein